MPFFFRLFLRARKAMMVKTNTSKSDNVMIISVFLSLRRRRKSFVFSVAYFSSLFLSLSLSLSFSLTSVRMKEIDIRYRRWCETMFPYILWDKCDLKYRAEPSKRIFHGRSQKAMVLDQTRSLLSRRAPLAYLWVLTVRSDPRSIERAEKIGDDDSNDLYFRNEYA